MSSKVVKRETEAVTVQSFLAAAHKENSKVSASDLTVAIASVGIGTMTTMFAKYIAPKMGKVLEIVGFGLTLTGFVAIFLKDPNKKQLQSVLDSCAKLRGTYILTTTELVEYVGWSGNNITYSTKTTYSFH
ncbi:hypothetical protein LAV73_23620 [Lysinibacillus xylanilyticus]|uniref:hypothetical protein n=1 Tax=Lysinibacillus xylanilyticus TaxID=582475 RepID=UPI002B2404D7|nr:hypothetical protein [Lysinibacillus xylanilyticus]MEB2282911.1 hypothetical protein [Lysinibacillus xylanilyticus]